MSEKQNEINYAKRSKPNYTHKFMKKIKCPFDFSRDFKYKTQKDGSVIITTEKGNKVKITPTRELIILK